MSDPLKIGDYVYVSTINNPEHEIRYVVVKSEDNDFVIHTDEINSNAPTTIWIDHNIYYFGRIWRVRSCDGDYFYCVYRTPRNTSNLSDLPERNIEDVYIINARQEFINHVSDNPVLSAKIIYRPDQFGIDGQHEIENEFTFCLTKNYTDLQYEEFLRRIDFDYQMNDDYECDEQIPHIYGEIVGNIWYENGSWSDRILCKNTDKWCHLSKPDIPEDCGGNDVYIKAYGKQ